MAAARDPDPSAADERRAAQQLRRDAKRRRVAGGDERQAADLERQAGRLERQAGRSERQAARAARREARAERPPLPEPPWWTSDERRSARSALSREAIVDAALEVLDRHGLDGLSMRRVAEQLGTGPASLYWHVANKDQLVNVILDRIVGEIELPEPDPEHWEDQLRGFARDGRDTFRRHRDIARATLGRVPVGPNLATVIEWQLELLARAGIPPRAAAWFGDLFALFIGAQSYEDSLRDDDAESQEASAGAYLAALPEERFPYLLAAGAELMGGGPDERFEFGLDLLIRGLRSFATGPEPPG